MLLIVKHLCVTVHTFYIPHFLSNTGIFFAFSSVQYGTGKVITERKPGVIIIFLKITFFTFFVPQKENSTIFALICMVCTYIDLRNEQIILQCLWHFFVTNNEIRLLAIHGIIHFHFLGKY